LRHPWVGYLVATLLELIAVAAIMLLRTLFPAFAFRGVFTGLIVVMIALGWGVGPALFATLMGTLLLYLVVATPHFSFSLSNPVDAIGLVLYLAVGFSISLLARQSERAHRHTEAMNLLLTQAEARSRSDAQRLRTVLDVLPTAVVIAGPEGQLLEMNQAARTTWGEEAPMVPDVAQYAQYKGWWVRNGQPLAPEDWALARAVTRGEVSLNEELEIETFAGQRKLILNSVAPIRDETGAIRGAVVSEQDITEMRRLEREVAARAQEREVILETMVDGLSLMDAEGRVVQTNRAFRVLLGVDKHPEYATRLIQERMPLLALRNEQGQLLPEDEWPPIRVLRGETLSGADIFIKNLEGREMVINVSGAPLRDQTGRVTGGVQAFRDVTERYRLEKQTRETLNALVAMGEALVEIYPTNPTLEQADEAPPAPIAEAALPVVARHLAELTRSVLGCRRISIAALDAPTGVLSPVMAVGLPPEQEQAWWASWSSPQCLEERYDAATAAALYAGKPVHLDSRQASQRAWDYLFQAQTGLMIPMRMGEELVGLLLVDYGDPDHNYASEAELPLTGTIARLGALVLERDRLLHRWAETRANELALRATKEQMDTFLGMASHELKSPLTATKLSLQMTQRRFYKLTSGKEGEEAGSGAAWTSSQKLFARSARQLEQLERLVNDLVDVSRVQAGRLELHPEDTDLVPMVREAVEAQQQAAPDRAIRLSLPAEGRAPVFADPGRIEQVVTNYLTNALKYSPADCPVAVGVEVEAQQARVWVRDQGPGLPLEEQERIWERFHRVKGIEVQSGTGIGLGLGLHICRTIIERHQGQVGVESAPGEGSTFWFTVPVGHPADADQRAV
jgi:PAS domain S-box-containing protein